MTIQKCLIEVPGAKKLDCLFLDTSLSSGLIVIVLVHVGTGLDVRVSQIKHNNFIYRIGIFLLGRLQKNYSVFYSKVVRCLLFMQQLNIKTKDFKLSKIAIFCRLHQKTILQFLMKQLINKSFEA